MLKKQSGQEILVPPVNFSMVAKGIYRGAYPNLRNIPFLKHLHIKTVLFLCPEDYVTSILEELRAANIRVVPVPIEGNKEPFKTIPPEQMKEALKHITDSRNHPIYELDQTYFPDYLKRLL